MADQELTTRDLAGTSETSTADADSDAGQADRNQDASDQDVTHDQSARDLESGSPSEREAESANRASDSESERAGLQTEAAPSPDGEREPLLPNDQSERFAMQWQEIQASFVDQPRQSVEQADLLVADLMQRLAASFSKERDRLEAQWGRGDDVSTEDLRVALTRYRSFFGRLLSA